MGCAVNGPGEAGDADFGIAGGRDVGFIYAHGRVLQEGVVGDPDRRSLPRDRRLDRERDAAAEASEDGEARCARDGRGQPDPARLTRTGCAGRLTFPSCCTSDNSSCRPCGGPRPTPRRCHKLLVRAGFIRQVWRGLWTFLPLGWRVHEKLVEIVREEMNAIGGQEMFMPVITPAELWQKTRALPHPGAVQVRGPERTATSCSR